MTRVAFLTPRLPPAPCGVGDHTDRLAQALAARGVESQFVYRYPPQPAARFRPDLLERWDGRAATLVQCVKRQSPDCLWVQLSGYGYSRWGAPYRLGQALRALRKHAPSLRLVVCMHEGHCPAGDLGWKGPLLSPWQRHTVGVIARIADVAIATIPWMKETLLHDYRVQPDRIRTLPIGSNIPVAGLTDEERAVRRADLGWAPGEIVAVSFGKWSKQEAAVSLLADCLVSAAERGNLHRVVCVGGGDSPPPPSLRRLRLPPPLDGKLEILGGRDAAELAAVLACCDVGLSFTPRELIGKSGGFLAVASQGIPVVVRGQGDPGFGLAECEGCMSPERFASMAIPRELLSAWGRELQSLVLREFGWDSIGRRAEAILCGGTGDLGKQETGLRITP